MTNQHQPNSDRGAETLRLLTQIAEGIQALREEIHYLTSLMEPGAADTARLTETLDAIGQALARPAAPLSAVASPDGQYRDIQAEALLLSYDDQGKPAYKIKGQPYSKFGVRVWPEVLSYDIHQGV